MLQSLRNIWDIPDLRKRVLFTLGLLAVYRLGNHVPTPGINAKALIDFFEQNRANWFGLVDMFSGGNLSRVTVFALGIMPYISASIILQLLTVVWPYLEKLSKEGELGRRKITQYTRYGTVLLSIVQSLGIAVYLEKMTLGQQFQIVATPGIAFKAMTVLTLTTGTAFIMWLGEQITERGIGNGMSLLIFAGIVVGFPRGVIDSVQRIARGELGLLTAILLIVMMVLVVGAIVFVERGQRRITVQYAKRVVGRRMYAGQSTHLPLRVNTSGVIPVIFASSLIAFPQTIPSSRSANNPSMHSSGPAHGGVAGPHPGPHHLRRRHLPRPRRHPSRVPHHRLQGRAHPLLRADRRRLPDQQQPLVGHGRPRPQLLFRRNLSPHHRRRGHGHGGPGGGAAHHAPLRRLQRTGQGEKDPWPTLCQRLSRRWDCASSSWALPVRARAPRPGVWPAISASPRSRRATCCATPSPPAPPSGAWPVR